MPVQDYNINTRDAIVGQTYGLVHSMSIHSAVVEGAGVDAGLAVQRGVADRSVAAGGGAVSAVYGICVLHQNKEATLRPSDGEAVYTDGDVVGVLGEGFINVLAKEAVSAGDPVYVDDVTGEFYQATAAGLTLATNMSYESSAGADEIAVVKIKAA